MRTAKVQCSERRQDGDYDRDLHVQEMSNLRARDVARRLDSHVEYCDPLIGECLTMVYSEHRARLIMMYGEKNANELPLFLYLMKRNSPMIGMDGRSTLNYDVLQPLTGTLAQTRSMRTWGLCTIINNDHPGHDCDHHYVSR